MGKNGPMRARLAGSLAVTPPALAVTGSRDTYWRAISHVPRGSLSCWLAESPAPLTSEDQEVGPLTTGSGITCATPRLRDSARPSLVVQSRVTPGLPSSASTLRGGVGPSRAHSWYCGVALTRWKFGGTWLVNAEFDVTTNLKSSSVAEVKLSKSVCWPGAQCFSLRSGT